MKTPEQLHQHLKHQLSVSYMLCTLLRDVYSDFLIDAKEAHPLASNKKFNKAINEAMIAMNNAQRHLHVDLDISNSQENKKNFSDDYLHLKKYIEDFYKIL